MPEADIDTIVASSRHTETITGNGSTTSFIVTHNKGTTDVIDNVREVATNKKADDSVTYADNTITIDFEVAPALGEEFSVGVL